jgi:hypothetical protein
VFLPFQPYEKLSESLSAGSVHVVTLKEGMQGTLVPSKFYSALAVAKPVIFVGPRRCEVADIILGSVAVNPPPGVGIASVNPPPNLYAESLLPPLEGGRSIRPLRRQKSFTPSRGQGGSSNNGVESPLMGECGFVVRPGDVKGFVDAVLRYRDNKNLFETHGQNGHSYFLFHCTRSISTSAILIALSSVARAPSV